MKRHLIGFLGIFSLLLLMLSCEVDGGDINRSEGYTQGENTILMRMSVAAPVWIVDQFILVDSYLSASDEEKKSEEFSEIRKKLFFDGISVYTIDGLGDFTTEGKSIIQKGNAWTLKASFYEEYFWLHSTQEYVVECLIDDASWTVTDEDGIRTVVMKTDDPKTYSATVKGERKSCDGYDLYVESDGEIKVTCSEEYHWSTEGTLVHTVSRDGTVLDRCVGYYGTDNAIEYKITR